MRKVRVTAAFLKTLGACSDGQTRNDGLTVSTDLQWNINNVPLPIRNDVGWVASSLDIDISSYQYRAPCGCGEAGCTYGPLVFTSNDTVMGAATEIADVLLSRHPELEV